MRLRRRVPPGKPFAYFMVGMLFEQRARWLERAREEKRAGDGERVEACVAVARARQQDLLRYMREARAGDSGGRP